MTRILPLLLAATIIAATPAQASLIGVQVNGSLTFGGGSTNYFQATNGFVPAGYGNAAGQPVTIAQPAIEFGFQDDANRDTANFTATQLVIGNDTLRANSGNPWRMTFTALTPGAFSGLTLVSSNFTGLTYSIANNVITINWAGGSVPAGANYRATFNIAEAGAVPEPTAWALMIGGFGLIGTALRRRRVSVSYSAA